MSPTTLYREGTELDVLLDELDAQYPGRVQVLEITHPRQGGVLGFFAKQRVGVHYRLAGGDGSPAPASFDDVYDDAAGLAGAARRAPSREAAELDGALAASRGRSVAAELGTDGPRGIAGGSRGAASAAGGLGAGARSTAGAAVIPSDAEYDDPDAYVDTVEFSAAAVDADAGGQAFDTDGNAGLNPATARRGGTDHPASAADAPRRGLGPDAATLAAALAGRAAEANGSEDAASDAPGEAPAPRSGEHFARILADLALQKALAGKATAQAAADDSAAPRHTPAPFLADHSDTASGRAAGVARAGGAASAADSARADRAVPTSVSAPADRAVPTAGPMAAAAADACAATASTDAADRAASVFVDPSAFVPVENPLPRRRRAVPTYRPMPAQSSSDKAAAPNRAVQFPRVDASGRDITDGAELSTAGRTLVSWQPASTSPTLLDKAVSEATAIAQQMNGDASADARSAAATHAAGASSAARAMASAATQGAAAAHSAAGAVTAQHSTASSRTDALAWPIAQRTTPADTTASGPVGTGAVTESASSLIGALPTQAASASIVAPRRELQTTVVAANLAQHVAAIGVPPALIPQDAPHAYAAIEALVDALPDTPLAPEHPGGLLVIAGPAVDVLAAANDVRAQFAGAFERVWTYGCSVDASMRHAASETGRLESARHAVDAAADLHSSDTSATMVVVATDAPGGATAANDVIRALDADAVWLAVDATRKTEDTARWADAIDSATAVIALSAERSLTPATLWSLGLPTALLDGRVASRSAWAVLLLSKLSDTDRVAPPLPVDLPVTAHALA